MPKVIITLEDLKISPRAKSKLNVEIKFEPLRLMADSKAQELGNVLIDCIDSWRQEQSGKIDKITAERDPTQ